MYPVCTYVVVLMFNLLCTRMYMLISQSSSFFNSNTVPLKLSFLNSDPYGENIDIIFKVKRA